MNIKHDIALETIDDSLVEGEFSIVTESDGGMSAVRNDGKKIPISGVRANMLISNIRDSYVRIKLKTGEIALVPKGSGKLPFRDTTTIYNELIAQKVIDLILDGSSLSDICKSEGFPSRGSISRWFIEEPKFKQAYDMSKKIQSDFLESEVVGIADNSGLTKEEQGRAKIMVDTRMRLVKGLKAGYGEKDSTVGGVVFNLNFDPEHPERTKIIDDGKVMSKEEYHSKYSLDSNGVIDVEDENEGEAGDDE